MKRIFIIPVTKRLIISYVRTFEAICYEDYYDASMVVCGPLILLNAMLVTKTINVDIKIFSQNYCNFFYIDSS